MFQVFLGYELTGVSDQSQMELYAQKETVLLMHQDHLSVCWVFAKCICFLVTKHCAGPAFLRDAHFPRGL